MSPKPSLSKRGEILNLLRRGKLERGEFWDFRFIPNTLGYARLVLVISKRHVPRAVRRNRLRRVIREFFRQQGATGTSKDLMIRFDSRDFGFHAGKRVSCRVLRLADAGGRK